MDHNKNQDLLFELIKDKSVLKQDVFNNIILNFKILKNVLKEVGDDLKDRMSKVDDRVVIEYKDSGEFEAQLRVSGDLLVFQMHSNVFKFAMHNSLWKSSYLEENPNRGFCGLIHIYNFLNDSFISNRLVKDEGARVKPFFLKVFSFLKTCLIKLSESTKVLS